jgi:hypothetical protein
LGVHELPFFDVGMFIFGLKNGYHEKMKRYAKTPEHSTFKNLIRGLFRRNGFYITELHYEHIIPEEQFREILNEDFPKTEVAKIVRFSPDFFVMHGEVEPALGTFFIVCSPQSEPIILERDRLKCYQEYYPCDWIVVVSSGVSKEDEKIVYCERLNNFKCEFSKNVVNLYAKKLRTFSKFLESELGIKGADVSI